MDDQSRSQENKQVDARDVLKRFENLQREVQERAILSANSTPRGRGNESAPLQDSAPMVFRDLDTQQGAQQNFDQFGVAVASVDSVGVPFDESHFSASQSPEHNTNPGTFAYGSDDQLDQEVMQSLLAAQHQQHFQQLQMQQQPSPRTTFPSSDIHTNGLGQPPSMRAPSPSLSLQLPMVGSIGISQLQSRDFGGAPRFSSSFAPPPTYNAGVGSGLRASQQMGKPAVAPQQQTNSSYVTHSLKSENDLLRTQFAAMSASNKELRAELEKMKNQRDVEIQRIREDISAQHADRDAALVAEVQANRSQIESLTVRCAQLEEVLRLSAEEDDERVRKLTAMESQMATLESTITAFNTDIESFQKKLLPTFNAQVEGSMITPKNTASLQHGHALPLTDQLQRLDRNVAALRMVVDAKVETLILIRNKLKEENHKLKTTVEKLTNKHAAGESALTDYQKEKEAMRGELEELAHAYEAKLAEVRTQLKEAESRAATAAAASQSAQVGTFEDTSHLAERDALLRRTADLEGRLVHEEAARASLAADLAAQRKAHQKAMEELEALRLAQKFLGSRPPSDIAKLPIKDIDLMKKMNQLLAENVKLKEEKTALQNEVKATKRASVQSQVRENVTTREIELAAASELPESQLTTKLLRKQLAFDGMASSQSLRPGSASSLSFGQNYS